MSSSAKWALGLAGAAAALLYFLGPVLAPFALSAGLAYLGDPIVDRLERLRIPRTRAVIFVFLVLTTITLALLILLLPLLVRQVATFVTNIPDYLHWIQESGLPLIGVHVPQESELDAEALRQLVTENWSQAGGIAKTVLAALTHSGTALLGLLAATLLVPVVTFYLLRDWDALVAWVDSMLPPRHRLRVRTLAREADEVLAGFLRGQLLVMISLGGVYSLGLWAVGLDLALLIGLGAGIVSFVPYLGFVAGILAATIATVVQMQELVPLLYVVAVFMAGQVLESTLLTPNLVGDRIGLHPVAVIFAVLAGGHLFGFLGVLLALPAAAVIAVLLRHAKELWLDSDTFRSP